MKAITGPKCLQIVQVVWSLSGMQWLVHTKSGQRRNNHWTGDVNMGTHCLLMCDRRERWSVQSSIKRDINANWRGVNMLNAYQLDISVQANLWMMLIYYIVSMSFKLGPWCNGSRVSSSLITYIQLMARYIRESGQPCAFIVIWLFI